MTWNPFLDDIMRLPPSTRDDILSSGRKPVPPRTPDDDTESDPDAE
jgi:hypothetical protein